MTGHRRQLFFWAMLGFCLIGLFFGGCSESTSESESDQKGNMQDIRKEAGEAAQAAKEYAGQQKGKFMEEAKTALEAMDKRLAEFKREIESKWSEMDEDSRQKAEKALNTMKEKREALSKKIKELKDSSAEAWEKMKKDFWESYESLKDSIQSKEEEVTYI